MVASLAFALLLNHPRLRVQGPAADARLHADHDPARREHPGVDRLPQPRDGLAEPDPRGRRPARAPDWFNSEVWVYPALPLMGLWAIGNFMIINIAGLQSVPTELYEAARIDGAGCWTHTAAGDDPADVPGPALQPRHRPHRDVPVLHPGVHPHQRPGRPEQRDAVHQPRAVPRSLRVTAGWATARRSRGSCSPSSCS